MIWIVHSETVLVVNPTESKVADSFYFLLFSFLTRVTNMNLKYVKRGESGSCKSSFAIQKSGATPEAIQRFKKTAIQVIFVC